MMDPSLGETDLPSLSVYQLPVAPYLGVGPCEMYSIHVGM